MSYNAWLAHAAIKAARCLGNCESLTDHAAVLSRTNAAMMETLDQMGWSWIAERIALRAGIATAGILRQLRRRQCEFEVAEWANIRVNGGRSSRSHRVPPRESGESGYEARAC